MAHTHASESAHGNDETAERVRPSYDDINVSVLVLVGIISTIVTFLIIGFVQGLSYRMENAYLRSATTKNYNQEKINDSIRAQRSLLDGGEGGAVVPIEMAMDKVVERYGKNQSVQSETGDTGHVDVKTTDGSHDAGSSTEGAGH